MKISTFCLEFADVNKWLTEFSRLSHTNWNVRRTYTELTVLQRKDFVCHLNDFRHKSVKGKKSDHLYKNCDCPASLSVTCDVIFCSRRHNLCCVYFINRK